MGGQGPQRLAGDLALDESKQKMAPIARPSLCSRAMLRSEFFRRVIFAAMLSSGFAEAQQIVMSQVPDRRVYSDASKQAAFRSASKFPDWINYADCASNVLLHFQLAVTSIPTNGSLQVWAGTDDCSKNESRTGETTRTCWPVSGALASTQNVSVDVQSQHLVSPLGKTAAEKPKAFADLPAVPSAATCTSSSSGATALSLWFMFTDGSNNVLGTPLKWGTSVDVVGPTAPTTVSPTAGDGAVNLAWAVGDAVSDVSEYVLYCLAQTTADAAVSGDASADAASDAGTTTADADSSTEAVDSSTEAVDSSTEAIDSSTEDAGVADAGATSSSTCVAPWAPEPASPLSAEFATSIARYECGRVGGASRSSRVSGLSYGTAVAVAVAAVDQVDNMGGIRAGGCATPVRTVTFWDRYEDGGGDAGGCSFGSPGVPGQSFAVLALVGLAAALRLRLRRKGR